LQCVAVCAAVCCSVCSQKRLQVESLFKVCLSCVAVCCSVLQCVKTTHDCGVKFCLRSGSRVLQCAAVCCSVLQCATQALQCATVCCGVKFYLRSGSRVLLCIQVSFFFYICRMSLPLIRRCRECCSVLECATQVLQCVAVCCSMLQCATRVLQCVAVCNTDTSFASYLVKISKEPNTNRVYFQKSLNRVFLPANTWFFFFPFFHAGCLQCRSQAPPRAGTCERK